MEPSAIEIQCESSFWLYSLIWGAILPLFFAYLAAAAYAFNRRRGDGESALEALEAMDCITMLALDRMAGAKPDARQVQTLSQSLIRRVRLEAIHRPERVRSELREILEDFLANASIAAGQRDDTFEGITSRMISAENRILSMLRQQTIYEALRQAWTNPGTGIDFDSLYEKVGLRDTNS